MNCFSEIIGRSLQAQIVVKKWSVRQQTVLLGVLHGESVLVFVAFYQLIYHSHILFSGCAKDLGRVKLLSAAGSKIFFAISKWRMASNVLPETFRNHNNLNCNRIFRAKRQLSLIPLNRTAALPAALSNLTLYRMVMPIGTPFLKEKINN